MGGADGAATSGSLTVEDDRHQLGAGHAMRLAGAVKRAAWDEIHGFGICDVAVEIEAHPAAGRSVASLVAEYGPYGIATMIFEAIGAIPRAVADDSFDVGGF